MSDKKSNVLSVFMNQQYRSIVKTEGIYLYDSQGKRYIDGSGGPMLCSLGHGLDEMANVIQEQTKKAAYVFRLDFTTPELEEACTRICKATAGKMDKVFMVSGGSEATETTIKLARKYHIDNGSPSKFKIISRWLSYHGMTGGALTLSGFPGRRADYVPYIHNNIHIPPAYCYRCWSKQQPESCDLACADALEKEIMCQGPETVAAFMAEPISGMSLCAAMPRQDYFKRIREICDKFDVLLMMDEVMTGVGRTGKFFGYEHFDTVPDIMALGKGLSGGYYPLGAAVITTRVAEVMEKNSGVFLSGHTWAGNPVSAVVASKVIDYMEQHDLIHRADQMGQYLAEKLKTLKTHPSVGDIRAKA